MHVQARAHTHILTYAHINKACAHKHTCGCTDTLLHAHSYTHTDTHIHTLAHTCIQTHMRAFIHIYVHPYKRVCANSL